MTDVRAVTNADGPGPKRKVSVTTSSKLALFISCRKLDEKCQSFIELLLLPGLHFFPVRGKVGAGIGQDHRKHRLGVGEDLDLIVQLNLELLEQERVLAHLHSEFVHLVLVVVVLACTLEAHELIDQKILLAVGFR